MRCGEARRLMSLRLDGRIGEVGGGLVDEHLRGCAECLAHWVMLKAARNVMAAAGPATPDEGMAKRIAQNVFARALEGSLERSNARVRAREEAGVLGWFAGLFRFTWPVATAAAAAAAAFLVLASPSVPSGEIEQADPVGVLDTAHSVDARGAALGLEIE